MLRGIIRDAGLVLVVMALGASCLVCQGAEWEYRIVRLHFLCEQEQLAELGKEGWEITVPFKAGAMAEPRYIFKGTPGTLSRSKNDLTEWLDAAGIAKELSLTDGFEFGVSADGKRAIWILPTLAEKFKSEEWSQVLVRGASESLPVFELGPDSLRTKVKLFELPKLPLLPH